MVESSGRTLGLLTVLVSLLSLGSVAEGQAITVAFKDRPLTVPNGTLRVDSSFAKQRHAERAVNQDADALALRFGAALGLGDNVELGGSGVVPLDDLEETDVGSGGATVYLRYRYVAVPYRKSFTEAAVELVGNIDPAGGQGAIGLSAPVRASPGPFRFDTGVEIQVNFVQGPEFASLGQLRRVPSQDQGGSAGLPASAGLNVAPWLFLGLRSGLGVRNIKYFADTLFVPLGFFTGVTLGKGPFVADIAGSFDFQDFWAPTGGRTNADAWIASVTVSFFIDTF